MSDHLEAELRKARAEGGLAADHAEVAMGSGSVSTRLEAAIRAFARHRGPSSSTCPSDAARVVGGDDWRDLMEDARCLARELAKAGDVEIVQRGVVLDPDAQWRGPIRIRER